MSPRRWPADEVEARPEPVETLPLFAPPPEPLFAGSTCEGDLDNERLARLLDRVRDHMLAGGWHTLGAIQGACGGSEASVSARLRDLRKSEFGGYTVERRRVGDPTAGLYEYRVQISQQGAA